MFVAVIFAHLLAVLFSFCGVVLLCAQFGGPRPESAAAFVSALVVTAFTVFTLLFFSPLEIFLGNAIEFI